MQRGHMKRVVGRPRKGENREGAPSSRDQIAAAAADVFAERGFEGASLDVIAERAGFSMGAIYHHFAGKPDLLIAVVDYALRSHDFPSAADGQPVEILEWLNFPQVYLDPANKQLRRLAAEIHTAASRYPDVATLLSAFSGGVTADIVRSIDAAKRLGLIAPAVESENTARMFMVNCVGLVHIDTFYPALLGDPSWTEFVLKSLRSVLGFTGSERAP